MIHDTPHLLAGQTVTISSGNLQGQEYRIEDWLDRVLGRSWMFANGNPACLQYAIRAAKDKLPTDNDVLYGKIGGLGYLVHVSQING